jgi:hypothetical protein
LNVFPHGFRWLGFFNSEKPLILKVFSASGPAGPELFQAGMAVAKETTGRKKRRYEKN